MVIREITWDDIGKLGVDENNQLYWNGKPIVTKGKIILEWWINLAAIITAVSAIGTFILELLNYIRTTIR